MKLLTGFLPMYSHRVLGMPPGEGVHLSNCLNGDAEAREHGFKRPRYGPGGGTPASPFNVAFLILAAATNEHKTRAATAAWALWHMQGAPDDTTRQPTPCFITGQTLFGDALEDIISNPDNASTVTKIELFTTAPEARIHWISGDVSRFVDDDTAAELAQSDTRTCIIIPGKLIASIATDLQL